MITLTYLGAFRLPSGSSDRDHFSQAGQLAYDPALDQIAMSSRTGSWAYLGRSAASESKILSELPITTRGPFQPAPPPSPYEGDAFAGFLVNNGQLIGAAAPRYYDANGTQTTGHYLNGAWRALADPRQGFTTGFMTWVPDRWRAEIGDFIIGPIGLPIISRTSSGPAAFGVGLDGLWAQPLVYYPMDHPLAVYDSNDRMFNQSMRVAGAVILGEKLVFACTIGVGSPCYGHGTNNPEWHNQDINGERFCYDPEFSSKSNHVHPYYYELRIYDLPALLNPDAQPWEHVPQIQRLPDVFMPGPTWLAGATTDNKGTLFLSQYQAENAEHQRENGYPVVHVFRHVLETQPQPDPEPVPIPQPSPIDQQFIDINRRLLALEATRDRFEEGMRRMLGL